MSPCSCACMFVFVWILNFFSLPKSFHNVDDDDEDDNVVGMH